MQSYGLEVESVSYLGYSNGANLLAAVMVLHPGLVRRAILLRGLAVLKDAPQPDLTGAEVLLLSGADDPFAHMAPSLEAALRSTGATVAAQVLPTGHALGASDLDAAQDWWHGQMPL